MIGLLKVLLGMGGEQVGPREAVQRINCGAVLVDVREPGEFAAGHAADAVHLPLGRIRAQGAGALDACSVPEGAEVLLVCQSGMRSRIAQSSLAKDARRRYVNVDGGMAAWAASGLPVVRGGSAKRTWKPAGPTSPAGTRATAPTTTCSGQSPMPSSPRRPTG